MNTCITSSGHRRTAVTLIEILVVISIITVLIALLYPALGMVRQRAQTVTAHSQVNEVHHGVIAYMAEHPRHRPPAQASPTDRRLLWDPSGINKGVINALLDIGCSLGLEPFDRSSAPPYAMMDPWGNPYHYQTDADVLSGSGPQRPKDLPGWNTAGTRPWGYVWSTGRKPSADGSTWIYIRDDQ